MNKSVISVTVILILLLLLGGGCNTESSPKNTPTITPTPTATSTPQPTTNHPGPTLSSLPSIADVVDHVRPAVVYIKVQYLYTSFFSQTLLTKSGSGVLLSSDGYILTNNHVVEDYRTVEVLLPNDDQTYEAQVIGTDSLSDLAVIKIKGQGFPTAEFSDTSKLRVGDWVIAIGNALGLEGGPTVTLGIVSNLERSFSAGEIGESAFYDVIQTDADINQGNSGGPLVDLDGRVVGINTFVISSAVETAGFAVNTSTARRVYEDIVKFGRVMRPYMGIRMQTVTPDLATDLGLSRNRGVMVSYVAGNSPANKGGLKVYDVIVSFGGHEVHDAYQLTKILWQCEIGDSVNLDIWRGDDEKEIQITLSERPE